VRRRSGRGTRRSGGAYRGVVGLLIGALGVGALILFLLRRTQGDVGENVKRVSETAKSKAEEYAGVSRKEPGSQEAAEHSTNQEKSATESAEDQGKDSTEDQEEGLAKEHREELRGIIRESVRRSEESSADQEEKDAAKGTREELRDIIRESIRRSEKSSSDREESSAEETAEKTGHTSTEKTTSQQMTVVGVLAKMGESFQETGGGQFILSSEDEGNFDLHGKEDELDDVYQQQVEARVIGKITDEDSQPRKMEVDKVEPA
jgi:hypothetical protein